MHDNPPVFHGALAHQPERYLPAPNRRYIAAARHVHGRADVVRQIVGVQVQLGAVDKIKTSGQNCILFLLEMLVEIGRHGRFNRDGGDILLRRSDALDDVVRARRCAKVEAQFVQPGLTQRTQIFLRAERAVGVHVLMNPGGAELADDIGIQFDFHERLQIDVADAGRSVRRAEQQVDILHAEVRPADFPQPFADGLLAIQLAVIVAERAADVALVRPADGAQSRAGQAGRASLGKFRRVADEVRPPAERVQIGNLRHQFLVARVHRGFNLADDGPRQLLLMRHQRLIFRQLREETKPH